MGVTILIIEGDNMLQQHLARHFKIQNWLLFNAMQLKDIKRMFKKHAIDVILLSLNDLKKEGLVLIKKIKRMRPSVQIITVNSADQISLSIEGMKLGAFDDFLMPLDLDSLILRIRDAYQARKDAGIIKSSLLRRCQNLMVAASFAEVGEVETAKEMLAEEPNCKETKKPRK
jgi:two-component system, OmpR family, response regulator